MLPTMPNIQGLTEHMTVGILDQIPQIPLHIYQDMHLAAHSVPSLGDLRIRELHNIYPICS